MREPRVGDDVHFVAYQGEHRAAKVTSVRSGAVSLVVFSDFDTYHVANVGMDEGHGLGTWHYPEAGDEG